MALRQPYGHNAFESVFGEGEGFDGVGYDAGTEDDDPGTAVIGGGPSSTGLFDMYGRTASSTHTPKRNSGSGSWGSNGNSRRRPSAVDAMISGTPVTGGLCQLFGAARLDGKANDSSPGTPSTPMPTCDHDFLDMSMDAQTPMPGFGGAFSGSFAPAVTRTSMYLSVDLSQNRLYQKRMQRRRSTGPPTHVEQP
mmetsp:Transcript_27761/g.38983  ORF Transcript_27761/g.38983 Transcript_27761/m.38983 type:complete len:194 (-) Transcript_27761:111-692(-)